MTPRSLSRIHEDDELLDALGGRGTVSDDGLPGMLQAWVAEIDTTPGAVRRTGKKRRHAMRLAGAGGVVLATLSISSVAAAVSGTDVPVLHQLGQVANAFWDDRSDRQQRAEDLPPEVSIDGGDPSGSSSSSDGRGSVPAPTDSGTSDSGRPGSSSSDIPGGATAPSSRSARPTPSDLPRVPAPRSTNPGAGVPRSTSAPSSPRTPRPTSTSVPRPTSTSSRPSSSTSPSSSPSSSTPSSSSSAPSSTRPSPTSTRTPTPGPKPKPTPKKPQPTKKLGPSPTEQAPDPGGRRTAPPEPTDAPGAAPSASQRFSPPVPSEEGAAVRLPGVLHAEADL